jgi:High potential iron-sulfur protein
MTMISNRRTFMMNLAVCGTAVAAGLQTAQAAEPANKLDEASALAGGLGYKHDSAKADVKKYPLHKATDKCSNCQLFQGGALAPCLPRQACRPMAGAAPGRKRRLKLRLAVFRDQKRPAGRFFFACVQSIPS